MIVYSTISSFRAMRRALASNVTVGFVPTMGALHEGHLTLVREARKNNDVVVASIFVNPKQFGANEDLDRYPRQLEHDKELLKSLGVDHVLTPSNDVMYGPNFSTYVHAPEWFEETQEGRARPGHFRGVATVVTKLFNIVQPTRAYFGQKDAAQCVLIRRLVQDLNFPVEVRIMDTVRESDGLALSSRNAYLSTSARRAAPIVYAALCAAKDLYHLTTPATTSQMLENTVRQVLQSESQVDEIEYIACDSYETMMPLTTIGEETAVLSLAVKLGSVRLIDNVVLGRGETG
jgi:pantoate--beta-alanine ligase